MYSQSVFTILCVYLRLGEEVGGNLMCLMFSWTMGKQRDLMKTRGKRGEMKESDMHKLFSQGYCTHLTFISLNMYNSQCRWIQPTLAFIWIAQPNISLVEVLLVGYLHVSALVSELTNPNSLCKTDLDFPQAYFIRYISTPKTKLFKY